EAFEPMVLPRRVTRRLRPARLFYRSLWTLWHMVGRHLAPGKRREYFLSVFGPLSLLGLFATWVLSLVAGFALLHWSLSTVARGMGDTTDLGTYLYLSGITFFTLGYGEVIPLTPFGNLLIVAESGLGLGFLAVIIGSLPALYQ